MIMKKQNSENIYWRTIPKIGRVKDNGYSFTYDGALIFWYGSEASQAQTWLTARAARGMKSY